MLGLVGFILLGLSSCGLGSYGDVEFDTESAIEATAIKTTLGDNDSMEMTVKGDVTKVCQAKGCWMNMDIGNGEEMTITFKDYGFFVPKNSGGNIATIHGYAKVKETSVAQLREYAKDAGNSEEEIASITEPKTELTFVADGVVFP